MPIDNRRLTLWAYSFTNSNVPTIVPYSDAVDRLRFTTIAPGGYGDLTCRIKTRDARLTPPELTLMSQVALMGGDFAAFLGRWDEPGITLDQQEGDMWELTAMSAASVLQDDPDSVAYTSQTAPYILQHELARRSAYLPLSTDTSLILPNNPAALLSPVFDGKHLEDELNELIPVLGDYQWCVWGHGSQQDAAGFPLWQLVAHMRDTTTVSYVGYTEDFNNYHIKPAMEYTYNVITLKYRDITTNTPSSVTVSDTRLNANGSQGSAPYPRRKLIKDYSAYHLSATQAAAIANALLAQYQNGGWKIEVILDRVEEANGQEIPLWMVRADGNIHLPQLAQIGAQLPSAPMPQTTVFYITETVYEEQDGQPPQLTITCDSFFDKSSFQVARLQYREDHKVRSAKHRQPVTIPGENVTGQIGVQWGSASTTSFLWSASATYGSLLTNTPTSITLTPTSTSNVGSVVTNSVTNQGFNIVVTPAAAGAGNAQYNYITVGA
jgi:hypothetical protein